MQEQPAPTLLVIDVQKENNNRWGGRIAHPIARLQYRYADVRFSLFQSSSILPELPFMPASHAKVQHRTNLSAVESIADLVPDPTAQIHICGMDTPRSIIRTAFDLSEASANISFLSNYLASPDGATPVNAALKVLTSILPNAPVTQDTGLIPQLLPELIDADHVPNHRPHAYNRRPLSFTDVHLAHLEDLLLQCGSTKGINARAIALIYIAAGEHPTRISTRIGLNEEQIANLRRRASDTGVMVAVRGNAHQHNVRKLADIPGQLLIQLAQSPPPPGQAFWTARMLAQELVQRRIVDNITPEAVKHHLRANDVKYHPPNGNFEIYRPQPDDTSP